MEYGLPGGLPAVHPDVLPVGFVFRFDDPLCNFDRLAEVFSLLVFQLEVVPSDLVGYDEHMARRDGLGVLDDEETLVHVQYPLLCYLREVSHFKTPFSFISGLHLWMEFSKATLYCFSKNPHPCPFIHTRMVDDRFRQGVVAFDIKLVLL